jgi:aromatic ring-cleaving dioxygenase
MRPLYQTEWYTNKCGVLVEWLAIERKTRSTQRQLCVGATLRPHVDKSGMKTVSS